MHLDYLCSIFLVLILIVLCSKLNHAGLTQGNTCFCSATVNGIGSFDFAKCDLSCPKKPNDSCGGVESVQTYRITTPCQTGEKKQQLTNTSADLEIKDV